MLFQGFRKLSFSLIYLKFHGNREKHLHELSRASSLSKRVGNKQSNRNPTVNVKQSIPSSQHWRSFLLSPHHVFVLRFFSDVDIDVILGKSNRLRWLVLQFPCQPKNRTNGVTANRIHSSIFVRCHGFSEQFRCLFLGISG